MVEVDGGNRRGDGLNDVRGVEPPAESDLQDSDVDVRPPKQLEPDGRGHLEERGRRFERSVREQAVDQDLHFLDEPDEDAGVDRRAVDRKPLFEADQVRRCVAANLQSRRTQGHVGHRRHRPFAVRAGNQDALELCVGVAERGGERLDVREPELDAEFFEA